MYTHSVVDNFIEMKCPNCTFEHESINSLRIHAAKSHNLSARDLYVTVVLNGIAPTCKCGCGTEPIFLGVTKGFGVYIRGHVSRVKNNWGHNPAIMEKSQQTRRDMFANGELTTWNSGLSVETDSRMKAQVAACSQTIMVDPERRKIRSERMTANRLSGIVPTLTGSAHSQWNGGSSAVQPLARAHLHRVWTYPKLKEANFTCCQCGSSKDLCVHHNEERFATILRKGMNTIGDDDGTFDRRQAIAEWVADYHVNELVPGIVLCFDCHMKEHASD